MDTCPRCGETLVSNVCRWHGLQPFRPSNMSKATSLPAAYDHRYLGWAIVAGLGGFLLILATTYAIAIGAIR